jgi:hypothetical protein
MLKIVFISRQKFLAGYGRNEIQLGKQQITKEEYCILVWGWVWQEKDCCFN